jgi:Na+-transporting NADH:ubiquinone oxidoreductase subunit C
VKRDSVLHTFKIALLLCLVCSVMVSMAAVGLRGLQKANQELDKQRNLLIAAGLYDEGTHKIVIDGKPRPDLKVGDLFDKPSGSADRPWLEEKIINLKTGKEISEAEKQAIKEKFGSVERYSARKASRSTSETWSRPVPADKDVARIKRRENFAAVYLVRKPDGSLDQVILPIRGYGLWSTLWGFISLKSDLVTIGGITYYEQAETPGLGGEVDNPKWKALWHGKKAYKDGKVEIRVIKGSVGPETSNPEYKVDGLSGATLTSNGVSNMLKYWLGPEGFEPYMKRLKAKMSSGKK